MTTTETKVASGKWQVASQKKRAVRHSSLVTRHAEASRYLVGGVNSPVRAFRQVGQAPLVLVRARGTEVTDTSGRAFVDFIMGWGALILGHNSPMVRRALRQQLGRGVMMGLTHPAEMELARLIVEAAPSVEQVRFTTSGTEACMTAVRLARAHTGRTKILMFEGCYHGHSDSVMARKTAGIPSLLERETLTIPFNDLEALESTMPRVGDALACVIVEPVAANMGVVVPATKWLARLRQLAHQHGSLLIFDEVVTGFRLGRGGAQALFGITPDLTTFGKIIGGGLPIGALGGPRRLMQRLAPDGDVYHGGTFAGHPLSMAAGIATLKELKDHPPYERLETRTRHLARELSGAADRLGVAVQVNQVGSMFTLFFSKKPVRDFTQAKASDRSRFARWANALRREGILVPPSPFEALFLSTVHTEAQLDRLIRTSHKAFGTMTAEGR